MPNIIYLTSLARSTQNQKAPRTLARALILKLNPPQSGDIAAILEPQSNGDDLECVLRWLDSNQNRLPTPFDCDQCFELLCSELNDLLSPQ